MSATLRLCVILGVSSLFACGDEEIPGLSPEAADPTLDTLSPAATAVAGSVESVLLAKRATWSVHAQGVDLGTSWRNDPGTIGWSTATGVLGYGESYLTTTIPFGPDPNRKFITTYIKKPFLIDDPSKVLSLRLDVMYDDGFVFYVNGQEGGRASMPGGAVGFSTLALGHEANNSYVSFDASSVRGALKPGLNLLSFELHQSSPSSSDLVFDASLVAQLDTGTPPPPPPSQGGIARRSVWSTWDRGGDLGTSWRASSFDDSGWASGGGPLGYGESYLATTISFGPSATNKHVTTYFRKKFTVDDPAAVTQIRGELMYDDGLVVYLNGQEIGRRSMPSGAVGASTPASGHEAGNAYEGIDWTAQKSLLVAGVNTIAVEVHQSSASSSDLVFDLALLITTGVPPPPPPPPITEGIARGSSWQYFDQGPLPDDWKRQGILPWPSGPAPLGYGESYLRTTVSFGPDSSNKRITTYFTRHFLVTDAASVAAIRGELMYDDGVVVYINGVEVGRASMPSGAVSFGTRAFSHEAGNAFEEFDWTFARSLLVEGNNIISAEVHQSSPSSSDLVFDLALRISQGSPAGDVWAKHPENPQLVEGSSPSVIKLSDTSWVMFFADPFLQELRRATSTDGIHWSASQRVLLFFGADFFLTPFVLFDGTRYRLWFEGGFGLRSSTSFDGITWTQPSGLLFPFDASYPTVLIDGGIFKMWYSNKFFPNDTASRTAFGYATSADGVNWTDHGEVFDPGEPGRLSVLKDGTGFRAWFHNKSGNSPTSIFQATSPDGIHWTSSTNPVLTGSGGGEGLNVSQPYVLRDGGRLRMYYVAQGIRMATSPP